MLKYCFVDLETTGVNPKQNAVIQIAGRVWIPAQETEEDFDFLVRPFQRKHVDPEALKVNHRTLQEIKAFPEPSKQHKALTTLLEHYVDKYDRQDKFVFVGYNASFDFNFMWQWFLDCDDKFFGSLFFTPCLDVMQFAFLLLHRERASMPNFKLATVAKHLEITVNENELHDAMYDIELTYSIFQRLTTRLKRKE